MDKIYNMDCRSDCRHGAKNMSTTVFVLKFVSTCTLLEYFFISAGVLVLKY